MNRRVWVCVGLIFGCVLVNRGASGQALPAGAGLPLNVKGAADANAFVTQIHQFIQDQVTHLQSADVAAQSTARSKLVAEAARGSTPSFYTVYAREWSAAASPLMAATSPLRLRLNVAIVSNVIAENGQTLELEPVVRLVLADKQPSVSLWGVRAARPLIAQLVLAPPTVNGGKSIAAVNSSKLTAALVAAVKDHAGSDLAGYIATDAYHALVVNEIPGQTAEKVQPLLPPLVEPILSTLEQRISLYATGPVAVPGAEREVTTFLSSNYKSANPAIQKRVLQDLVNLVTDAGQRCSLYTSKAELSQLRETLKYSTQALSVIAANPGVDSGLTWLRSIPPSAPPAEIETHTKQVWGTMQLVFKDLPKPPAIPAIEPAPVTAPSPSGATSPAAVP